jgi:predicted transcriptional regulator
MSTQHELLKMLPAGINELCAITGKPHHSIKQTIHVLRDKGQVIATKDDSRTIWVRTVQGDGELARLISGVPELSEDKRWSLMPEENDITNLRASKLQNIEMTKEEATKYCMENLEIFYRCLIALCVLDDNPYYLDLRSKL